MSNLMQVALKVPHNSGLFTYKLNDFNQSFNPIGMRVSVPFRNKNMIGVIIKQLDDNTESNYQIKSIEKLIDQEAIISKEQLSLIEFCSNYYLNPLGSCLSLALPKNLLAPKELKLSKKAKTPTAFKLSPEQEDIAQQIINAPSKSAFLLEGVTGSGKTLIYIKAAQQTLALNQSVLFLVPEIALTPQLVQQVEDFLGIKALVMHSTISPAKKRNTIFSLLRGQSKVLIGARSAIFAPLVNLGLIVVDEEHDPSLKQDESPRYHARDLALWRAKNEGAKIILGSATPSLESVFNAKNAKLIHLELKNRYAKERLLPEVRIIDLKKRATDVDFRNKDLSISAGHKMCILSEPLVSAMKEALSLKTQVLLFLNQRGFAKFGVCYGCGQVVECPHCSVSLTYYQKRAALLCHQCDFREDAYHSCKNCLKDDIKYLGLGTERLEEEVKERFPETNLLRLDRDVVRSQKRLEDTLEAMHSGKAQILIGTQMIAKGHDFQNVGLVGIVCADSLWSMPDFRASERAFQLLTQVAGRAGRGAKEGFALMQTFNPDHPSIKYAKDHDVKSFIAEELSLRKRFGLPPYKRSALIRAEHSDEETARLLINEARYLLAKDNELEILGPAPSPIERINNRFRFQCMILSTKLSLLHKALYALKNNKHILKIINAKKVRFIIDVDPQNMS